MHWRESGAGEAVLFVHAFPFHSAMWDVQLERLPAKWRGIAPDLRGFGRTPMTGAGPFTMERYADDLRRLLDHLRIQRTVVCGLSMGGYIALAFYRKYATRVRALVLASTKAGADTEEARAGRGALARRLRAQGARAATESLLPKLISSETRQSKPELVDFLKEMIQSNAPEGMARAVEAMAIRPSSEELLRSIDIPVLIMHGTEDEVVPRGDAQIMARGIRGAKLQLLADTGHLTNLEQPDAFNRFLNDFLLDLPPSVGSLKFA